MPKKFKKLPKWYTIARNEESKSAELHIFGDIGESFFAQESITAKAIIKELDKLSEKGINQLNVRIGSFGGSVSDGTAIYNALRRFPGSVSVNIETAYSIASYIAMAADPGELSMADNGQLMIHGPRAVTWGTARDHERRAEWLDKTSETMAPAYQRAGKTTIDVQDILQGENDEYFTADEALAVGLIDSIEKNVPEIQEQVARASARFQIPYTPNLAAVAALTEPEEITMPKKEEGDRKQLENPQIEPKLNVVEIEQKAESAAMARLVDRNKAIAAGFAPFLKEGNPHQAKAQNLYNECLADPEISAEQASQKLLMMLGEDSAPITPQDHNSAPTMIEDSRDKIRQGMMLAIAARMGGDPVDRGNEFRGQSLIQLASGSLAAAGIDVKGLTRREIAHKIFAVHTTADFPQLLGDSANKRLQAAYENFPSTWESIAARSETNDFKTVNLIRMGAFSTLALKPPAAQYEQGTIGEEGEQVTVRTKGRYIDFTREMLINDDLSGFDRLVTMMGRASARTINKDVYAVINSNPTMSDGIALYDAGHNNLAGAGAAISVAAIGARRAAMRKQTAPGQADEYLNIMPAVLAVPVVLEDHAREVVTSTTNTDDTGSNKTNIIRQWSPLAVVSDPELDNTSVTAWYLFSNPMDVPALEVVFLAGEQQPYMESEEEFLSDVLRWKVRHDVGVAANDWRGTQKNPGA